MLSLSPHKCSKTPTVFFIKLSRNMLCAPDLKDPQKVIALSKCVSVIHPFIPQEERGRSEKNGFAFCCCVSGLKITSISESPHGERNHLLANPVTETFLSKHLKRPAEILKDMCNSHFQHWQCSLDTQLKKTLFDVEEFSSQREMRVEFSDSENSVDITYREIRGGKRNC